MLKITFRVPFTDTVNGSWFTTYQFDGSRYIKEGYPPLVENGKVIVIKSDGDSVLLHFSPDNAKEDPEYDAWIVHKSQDNFFMMNEIIVHSTIFSRKI